MPNWMLYGANGYTGELIAREAVRRGQRPILAGRAKEPIERLARELGCEARVFGMDAIDLSGVALVLHCAGPFVYTSAPMVDACLRAGVHYLDITGEIEVFEAVLARDAEAKARGVTLIPGVGFDVVPTDSLAAMLHQRLPDANELWLAFDSGRAGLSQGTARTVLESIDKGGAIRRDGKIVRVKHLYDVRTIAFASGPRMAMTIPWGDVATAYHTTGIPNVRVYRSASPGAIARTRRLARLAWLLRIPALKRLAQKRVKPGGPSDEQRAASRVQLWGRVVNAKGEEATMTMSVPEGYTFTVLSALAAIDRVLADPRPGAFTPAKYFGSEFVKSIPGVEA